MSSSGYFGVNTLVFAQFEGALPFDVYLKLGRQKFTKVFNQGFEIERERLEQYVLKGTHEFYILKTARRPFLTTSLVTLDHLRDQNLLAREDAQHILNDLAAQTLSEIFSTYRFDPVCHSLSSSVVYSYLALTRDHPGLLPNIVKLAREKRLSYRHSILASVFALLLARSLFPEDQELAFNAGLGAYLHDIGMCRIDENVDEHSMILSPQMNKEIERHPRLGVELVAAVDGFPSAVKLAIYEHHEAYDGTGYPRGIAKDAIAPVARMVAIAENFSSLVIGSAESPALPPTLAMAALKSSQRLDPQMVSAFARLLKL